ncbi:uncharacterized protein LOC131241222 isoform X2 [Magnolia sinica]|uniref:uncharacterized protein LOC131241222 isoform X2 n=1 Tax=Magnolia sinica TaxID=86752 RepID=UPI00265AB9C7|nr:uncharacterized protein LOC131241222 isoform X2 [Magnolia sinica]
MPRSSRQKSRSQHEHGYKDSRERTDSEEEEMSRERKRKEDSGTRVSETAEKRKRRSPSQQGKDPLDSSALKRRKDRADSAVADRWNGSGSNDEPTKGLVRDSESRSSRRRESLSERKDEVLMTEEEAKKGSGRAETKRKSEKDLERKEVYKDVKEKERGVDRDKKVQDGRPERSADGGSDVSRKQGMQMGGLEEDHKAKREVEITEWKQQDELRNPELEKELDKRIRKRDSSGYKDKLQEGVRDGDDRRLSSNNDRLKNGDYKNEKHKDSRYSDKYREDLDRDDRHRDDKHRDERSRDHSSDRSHNKRFKDESKPSGNCHKKAKLHETEHGGSPYDDDRIRSKEKRERKRSSDDMDDYTDLMSRSPKEHSTNVEKKRLSSGKLDTLTDRGRSDSRNHQSDVHSMPCNSRLKSSPSSSTRIIKDLCRHGSRQAESRDGLSEERLQPNTASRREVSSVSGGTERVSESRSTEKPKQKDYNHFGESSAENSAASKYKRPSKTDHQASPIQLAEKSPSSTSGDRGVPNRAGVTHSVDGEEMGQRSASRDARDHFSGDDRGLKSPMEKRRVDELCQAEELGGEPAPTGNRAGKLPCNSPSLLPLQPPRLAIDNPSVLGSLEEDTRGQAGDRKPNSNNRYKRNGDPNTGRGQGNAWKGVPNWPSPANGFIPFQHGLPPSGFHAAVPQFPAPTLYGVRPSMDLSHTGLSFHMHDAERFPGHTRTFGWRTPADESFAPHLHGWDGSNGVFGDESNIYGRSDWDQNKHLMSSRRWEVNADAWKGQNGNTIIEFPTLQKESDYLARIPDEQSDHRSRNEQSQPEHFPAESIEIKRADDTPLAKNTAGITPVNEVVPDPSSVSTHDGRHFCCFYLSKLDISVDLALPESYQQCLSLLDMEGGRTGESNGMMHVCSEGDEEVGAKISNHSLKESLFPAITDTIFQRAMDLYKKQKEERNVKIPVSTSPGSELKKVSPASDEGKVEPVDDRSCMEHALPDTDQSSHKEGENRNGDSEGDPFGDSKEKESGTTSSVNVFGDGSLACEALMPELSGCRVNLSRIHNSPESTH